MNETIVCPVKINLTLRILGQKEDGYHELRSVFWKKNGAECLSVEKTDSNRHIIDVIGAKISGKNLLDSVLEFAAEKISVPPLSLKLSKRYPQGSGIGAGSGNAAALLLWLRDNCGFNFTAEEAAKLGADVAVLTRDSALNFACGIGEKLTPVKADIKLPWLLVFPKWTASTPEAYCALEKSRNGRFETVDYEAEANGIIDRLMRGERAGLLPNDFIANAVKEHPQYNDFFNIAERQGSLAWGMCGSGSAVFAAAPADTLDNIEYELGSKEFVLATERLD